MVDNQCISALYLRNLYPNFANFTEIHGKHFQICFMESKYIQEWTQKHGCNCNSACILLFWEWITLSLESFSSSRASQLAEWQSENQGLCQFPSPQPPDSLPLPNKHSGKMRGILLKILLEISLSVEKMLIRFQWIALLVRISNNPLDLSECGFNIKKSKNAIYWHAL